MSTHKTVVVPTSPSFLDGQVPSWNSSSSEFSMQLPTGGLNTVLDRNTLSFLSTAGLPAGTLAFVTTQLAYYQLDFAGASSRDVSPLTLYALDNASRRWRRLPIGHSKWQYQADWYIDGTGGSDDNDGSVGSPISTLAEYNARLGGRFAVDMIVNCTNLLETNLEIVAYPIQDPGGGACPTIRIKGDPGAATAGTVGSSANAVPNTNTAPTLSNSSTIGLLFKLTGGTSVGAVAWGADGAGTISEWVKPIGSPATAPAASVTFDRFNPLSWHTFTNIHVDTGLQHGTAFDQGTELVSGFGTAVIRSVVVLENFIVQLTNPDFLGCTGLGFFACRIKGCSEQSGRYSYIGCYFGGSQAFGIYGYNRVELLFYGCLLATSTQLSVAEESTMRMRNCLMIDATVIVEDRGYLELFRTGLFNSPSGITVSGAGYLQQSANFNYEVIYGSGNAAGILVDYGGTLNLGGFAMPKITGTVEFSLDGFPTAIPPIGPGATTIPTDIPMTTWLELANAQGTLVSYFSGSRVNR